MFIPIGTTIDGKFEVQRSLGSGGMGVVYECRQLTVDRLVALKFLTYAPSADPREQARFEREARVLSRLSHPNIVQFYSYGLWQGYPYIAMERLEGRSLSSLISEDDSVMDHKLAIEIGMQVCRALSHAHEQNIFHRDIKPSNIYLTESRNDVGLPLVKLIDFGLAKITGIDGQQKLTQTGMAIGSVLYMSPEQCMGLPVTAGTDIYALGCVLFEIFTGEPPFLADNGVAVMFQHMNEPITRAKNWHRLSRDEQHIMAKCLAKQSARRYRNALELQDDLEALLAGDAPQSALPNLSGDRLSAGGTTKGWSTSVRTWPYWLIGTVCGASILITLAYYQGRSEKASDTAETARSMPEGSAQRTASASLTETEQAYRRGIQLLDSGNAGEAVKHLRRANELADGHLQPVDPVLACDVKLALARALGQTGEYQAPLKLLKEVSLRSSRFSPGYRAAVAYQQADAWTNIFDEEKALPCAREATRLWEQELHALPGTPTILAYQHCFIGWSRIARAESALQRLREAEKSRRKALEYARQTPGDNSVMIFAGTLALAEVLVLEHKSDQAIPLLHDLQARQGKLPPATRSAESSCRLLHLEGQIHNEQHQYAAAERSFARALPVAESIAILSTRRHFLGYTQLQRALNYYPLHDIANGDRCLQQAEDYWSDAAKSFPKHIYLERARAARARSLATSK